MAGKSAQLAASRPKLNLSAAREKTGLTLAQIAESTKISTRFLRAVEAEDFEQLPGGIFNTSYIRQYACAIGYDPGEILTHYYSKTGVTPPSIGTPAAPVKQNLKSGVFRWLRASVVSSLL